MSLRYTLPLFWGSRTWLSSLVCPHTVGIFEASSGAFVPHIEVKSNVYVRGDRLYQDDIIWRVLQTMEFWYMVPCDDWKSLSYNQKFGSY